jgi:hypothetical protein
MLSHSYISFIYSHHSGASTPTAFLWISIALHTYIHLWEHQLTTHKGIIGLKTNISMKPKQIMDLKQKESKMGFCGSKQLIDFNNEKVR